MKTTLAVCTLLLFCSTATFAAVDTVGECNILIGKIRDRAIPKAQAMQLVGKMIPTIAYYYKAHHGGDGASWHFPLAGYTATAIGGKNGSGYIASGYDFFAGNSHGGHPAHDIFIHDTNQDGIDDNTHKEVSVLSACDGLVISIETNWQAGSEQRGGNYIWIYNPVQQRLYYYAHNSKVLVHVGDMVKTGTPIATVGRTGANAAKKRSPTHLHFMVLQLDKNNYPHPENTYEMLKKAK